MEPLARGEATTRGSGASWIVWIALLTLLVLAHLGAVRGPIVSILILLLLFTGLFLFIGRACGHHDQAGRAHTLVRPSVPPQVRIDDVFAVRETRDIGGIINFQGRLIVDPDEAAGVLAERFRGQGWTPILHEDDTGRPTLTLVPTEVGAQRTPARGPGLHVLLIALTLVTTTWAGALHQGVNLLQEPARFTAGLPYSLALMAILGTHEMGHYVAAIRHGMHVTLPYFIPAPFALGTFGAFIQLRSPAPSRRALFDVAVAGPLAGLAIAVPALLVGLPLSSVSTAVSGPGLHLGTDAASSILLTLIARVAIPDAMAAGHVIVFHPLAFAGWLGLLVTALNLIPIGQLDGGHIADAMFGPRASATIASLAMMTLVLLGLFVWSGLLFWAFIAFFIAGRKGLPPLNDLSVLDVRRLAVGMFSFAMLVVILLPVPHGLYETMGVHCPYL